ncbi:hypothetical protein BaRGS_00027379 [Batillaria attramentaria]|uniref:Uncharacterized protein n=1 Tax=Batillaria attramentaria TaxID=370345 RepID=A0ABD0K3K1_9CAEN
MNVTVRKLDFPISTQPSVHRKPAFGDQSPPLICHVIRKRISDSGHENMSGLYSSRVATTLLWPKVTKHGHGAKWGKKATRAFSSDSPTCA